MGTIVIGFDGTDCAEDALAFGVRLAAATGDAPLVVAVHPESPAGLGHVDAEWVAAMREQAQHMLDRARELQGGGGGVDYRLVGSSSAAHGLADVAEDLPTTTIVLGSGRRGPLRRSSVGSTTERLLHGTSTPVTVVPRGHRSECDSPVEVVGCAFVDSPDGHEALGVAADLARRAGARLRVLTAVAPLAEFSTFAGPETERVFTETARRVPAGPGRGGGGGRGGRAGQRRAAGGGGPALAGRAGPARRRPARLRLAPVRAGAAGAARRGLGPADPDRGQPGHGRAPLRRARPGDLSRGP
jgi:nucleotide-binding universal stress UspA family protein